MKLRTGEWSFNALFKSGTRELDAKIEALRGHKLEVAFDAIGGKAIDDLAEVVDDGGTILNYGSLGGNTGTNIYSLAPNNFALKSVHIISWFRLNQQEKQKEF